MTKYARSFKSIMFIRIAFGVVALLAGCTPSEEDITAPPPQSPDSISVTDSTGALVTLPQAAQRVVALAPHIVENLFSVGAGDELVGVVAYSDFPEAAKKLPLVGGYSNTNLEKIVELAPDLIIAWESGNASDGINRLRELGFTIYLDQPDNLEDVAKSLRDFGILTGHAERGELAATDFLQKIAAARAATSNKSTVSTFYQVWNDPLQTINGSHIISDAIELCGGQNIYADEPMVAPVINIESIIERDPQAIIASGMSSSRPEWLDEWQQWPSLTAVQQDNLFFVDPDHIQRHTVRILLGIAAICQQLDSAREKQK
ncbi:cobalamin-binding protein [Arenicella xantha]|uniref:Iron complex transport system substrate-binding protein n=1 Tax=Arenicella xantha TaxID=644221 RepID=A0A395JGJ8_9GAMM|nr:cobalamin-binding protein [Arenicella xantha]RBP48596.1 iron complex transport system substrate-binding protein [Arenicella xantha]